MSTKSYEIKEVHPLGDHPVRNLAYQSGKELSATFGGDSYEPAAEDGAVYVEQDGEIIAFIVWTDNNQSDCWLGQVWTHPDHRKQGLYRLLYDHAKKRALQLGYKTISCGVHPNNTVSVKTHEALGMTSFLYFSETLHDAAALNHTEPWQEADAVAVP